MSKKKYHAWIVASATVKFSDYILAENIEDAKRIIVERALKFDQLAPRFQPEVEIVESPKEDHDFYREDADAELDNWKCEHLFSFNGVCDFCGKVIEKAEGHK